MDMFEKGLDMSQKKLIDEEFRRNLFEGMQLMSKRISATNDDYFDMLKEAGIDFSEERIIEDYARIKDLRKLDDSYYEQYGKKLDRESKNKVLNSDVFLTLLVRIIPNHFDVSQTGDPYFIQSEIDRICNNDLRKADQKEIEKILRAFVVLSKTRNHHTIEDSLELFDINGLLKEMIRVCHNRDASFRNLMKEMYECYEDLDPKIFPSVYKEVKKSQK